MSSLETSPLEKPPDVTARRRELEREFLVSKCVALFKVAGLSLSAFIRSRKLRHFHSWYVVDLLVFIA
jgi:hypothetical protein